MKPVPLIVIVVSGDPTATEEGDTLDIIGLGFGAMIARLAAPEEPPPGEGLTTVTFTFPAAAMSAAVIEAVSCVALT